VGADVAYPAVDILVIKQWYGRT